VGRSAPEVLVPTHPPTGSAVIVDDRSPPDSEASSRSFRTGVDLTFPVTACPPSLTARAQP